MPWHCGYFCCRIRSIYFSFSLKHDLNILLAMEHFESGMETIDPEQLYIVSNDHSTVSPLSPVVLEHPSSKVVASELKNVQTYTDPLMISSPVCVSEDSLVSVEIPSPHSSFIGDVYIPSTLQFSKKQDIGEIGESEQPNAYAVVVDGGLNINEKERQKERKLLIPEITQESSVLIETTTAFFSESVTVNHMTIEYGTCNKRSLTTVKLSDFPSLISFTVRSCSFKHTEKCHLVNCPKLKCVSIEEMCFTVYRQSSDVITGKQNTEFLVENCPKLKEISIGPYSFYEYTKCTFRTLPSLRRLTFGKYNVDSCNFASCPMLELIRLKWIEI